MDLFSQPPPIPIPEPEDRRPYRHIQAVNFSSLLHMEFSPAHYQAAVLQQSGLVELPERGEESLGTVVHSLLCGDDVFQRDFLLLSQAVPGSWNLKENQIHKKEVFRRAEAKAKYVCSLSVYEKAVEIVAAMRNNRIIASFIGAAQQEDVSTWTDEETGILCKGLLDLKCGDMIADTKTCGRASRAEFQKIILKTERPIAAQAAMYMDSGGDTYKRFFWFAVETSAPYAVNILEAEADVLAYGRVLYRGWLRDVQQCRDKYGSEFDPANKWPGYEYRKSGTTKDIDLVFLPPWVKM